MIMDKTLLKDKPEFKERIEGNMLLRLKITQAIENEKEFSDEHDQMVLRECYFDNAADSIMDIVTTFINENYSQK